MKFDLWVTPNHQISCCGQDVYRLGRNSRPADLPEQFDSALEALLRDYGTIRRTATLP